LVKVLHPNDLPWEALYMEGQVSLDRMEGETAKRKEGKKDAGSGHRALLSNQRACAAMASGKLKEGIVPATLVGRKGETVLFLMWPVYMEFTS